MNQECIIYDELDLLMVFDEIMPETNEDNLEYWLKKKISNEQEMVFAFSVRSNLLELRLRSSLGCKENIFLLKSFNCVEIKVLDVSKNLIKLILKDLDQKVLLNLSGQGTIIDIDFN